MKYTIYFNGSCEIDAPTEEIARRKFWGRIMNDTPLPLNQYEIDEIIDEDGYRTEG